MISLESFLLELVPDGNRQGGWGVQQKYNNIIAVHKRVVVKHKMTVSLGKTSTE